MLICLWYLSLGYEESHFKTRTYSSLVTDHVYSLINTTSMNISSHYRYIKTSISIMSLSCITIAAHLIRHNTQITRATQTHKNSNNSTVHSLVLRMKRVRRVRQNILHSRPLANSLRDRVKANRNKPQIVYSVVKEVGIKYKRLKRLE